MHLQCLCVYYSVGDWLGLWIRWSLFINIKRHWWLCHYLWDFKKRTWGIWVKCQGRFTFICINFLSWDFRSPHHVQCICPWKSGKPSSLCRMNFEVLACVQTPPPLRKKCPFCDFFLRGGGGSVHRLWSKCKVRPTCQWLVLLIFGCKTAIFTLNPMALREFYEVCKLSITVLSQTATDFSPQSQRSPPYWDDWNAVKTSRKKREDFMDNC